MAQQRGKKVRVGCYSAAWGDTALSMPQLLRTGRVDYIAGDLLAELTMSILARKRQKNPKAGFATDFVHMVAQNMREIKRQGVRVCVNAGGINVEGCRDALLQHARKQGIDLKVAIVLGDDLMPRQEQLRRDGVKEMFSGEDFPDSKNLLSCNAYLGAFPVAEALRQGCDVVITGRCVDSALILGPLIYEHGWEPKDYDLLCAGTLAGHLVECGAQCTGGLFTDYEAVDSWVNIGYPIVEVEGNGVFTVQKPEGTDGLVSFGSVCEQMLYEIGDPGAYHVPDVACDFTQVRLEEVAPNVVRVTGARGQPPTATYKVSATFTNGWTWVPTLVIIGHDAGRKAKRVGVSLLTRWRRMLRESGMADFSETRIETIGAGQYFRQEHNGREVLLRVGVRHDDIKAIQRVSREWACSATSMAQGTFGGGGASRPQQVVSSFMFLVPKDGIVARVEYGGAAKQVPVPTDGGFVRSASHDVRPVPAQHPSGLTVRMQLLDLCWARSGDKGDYANIGLIARRPEYLPVLRAQVTPERVKEFFAHNCQGPVQRFDLPGTNSMNFLLRNTLGGGGSSTLHSDALAKSYGQVLLSMEVDVPSEWTANHRLNYKIPIAKL
eukprot:TRINITY_DN6266_c0_g1_i1.p1 TRINITY_DN6266_c0_g1~~TRINITY_DN6266_c0_g1_i1.p1  ORF type:complete len:637 (+),score=186.11 TRINITY_DN6266_c0_g1_i1:92-1912(+)